jgi:microcin C transport system ATP-binding protein
VTALSTVALLPDSATLSGSIRYMGDEMVGASEATLRKMRGNRISFIFQEPMTSLNPLHTLEKQLAESLLIHQGLRARPARARILELCTRSASRTPRRGWAPIRTSCRAGSGSG